MKAHDVALKLADELRNKFLYQHEQWLYRETTGWCYTNAIRLNIHLAMEKHKRNLIPSSSLADDIENHLRVLLTPHERKLPFVDQKEFPLAS